MLPDAVLLFLLLVAIAITLYALDLSLDLIDRLVLSLRLRFDKGLDYTWRRAWRTAGRILQSDTLP